MPGLLLQQREDRDQVYPLVLAVRIVRFLHLAQVLEASLCDVLSFPQVYQEGVGKLPAY